MKRITFWVLLTFSTVSFAVTDEQQDTIRQYLEANDWDQALELAEELVDEYPESSKAHYLLASAMRVKMQQVNQMRAMFILDDYQEALATAIELDPENIAARTEEIGFYMMAPEIAGGDRELAAEKIKALKQIDAISGLQMEARLATVNEDTAMAAEALQQLLQLKPNSPGALMQLAMIAMDQGDYLQADEYLLRITAEEDAGWPLLAQYQRAKARVVAKQDSDTAIDLLTQYQQALPQIESSMNLPDDSVVYWRLALAHENKGDRSKAIELLQKSVQLNGDFEPAKDDLDRLSD